MPAPPSPGYALVVALRQHNDFATEFIYPAAEDCLALLRRRLPTVFVGPDVRRDRFLEVLMDRGPPRILCVFGHGHESRPALLDSHQQVFLDGDVATAHLQGALIVMTCCLHSAAGLPEALIAAGVGTVVGYREVARVGKKEYLDKQPVVKASYRKALTKGFVLPVERWLRGDSVEQAEAHARRYWSDLACSGTFVPRISAYLDANGDNLRSWGDPTRRF